MAKRKIICVRCNESKPLDAYYKARNDFIWHKYNNKFPLCKKCFAEYFKELKEDYTPEEAILEICSILGVPFQNKVLRTFYNRNEEIEISKYITYVNCYPSKRKTFLDTMLIDEGKNDLCEHVPQIKTNYTLSDTRNKKYVLDKIGYDPYADRDMPEVDKKLSYNILAGFCDDDKIQNDTHKIQSCIELTNLHVQMDKIEREIDKQNNKGKKDVDAISSLITMKKNLVDTISKISRDNKIGAAYNSDLDKGSNTLTGKMKEMDREKLIESKVNRFDIKTCEAMQQISNINIKSILNQLDLDDSDYAKMITDMREVNVNQASKIDKLEEEVRLLKNRIKGLGYEC